MNNIESRHIGRLLEILNFYIRAKLQDLHKTEKYNVVNICANKCILMYDVK